MGYPEQQTVVTTVGRVWETRHRIGRPTQRIESWDRGKTVAGRLVERDWEIDSHTKAKIPRGWRGVGGVRQSREISRIVQTDKQRRGCPEAGVRQRSAKKSSDSDRQRETEADPFQRALDLSSVGHSGTQATQTRGTGSGKVQRTPGVSEMELREPENHEDGDPEVRDGKQGKRKRERQKSRVRDRHKEGHGQT